MSVQKGHMHLCARQQWVTVGHPLCIYFWPAAGPSSVGWCVCARGMCVRERILVWAFTFLWCFLSRCQIATYLFSRSLRMFCQPWPTYLFLRHCPLAGFTFRVSTKETVSIKPENSIKIYCTPLWNTVCLDFSSLLRWWLFSKGNCIPAGDWRAETVRLREGKICTAATPCSVYTICVTDELWMKL